MRLRKPCKEHGYYDAHPVEIGQFAYPDCPGGEFLPEDALVIEKVEGEWPESAQLVARRWCARNDGDPFRIGPHYLFNALADQVEPG